MNNKTLALILAISTTYISGLAFAEEPFIGIGLVNHTYDQDPAGTANDAEASPTSYRITMGSRIYKNTIIEAFYLHPKDADEITIGGAGTNMDVEYSSIFGASINYAIRTGSVIFYGGPNVTAAQIEADSGDDDLDNANSFDTRVSPGLGAGIDITLYKHISIDFNAQSYLIDSGRLGTGIGAELRYHF